MAPVLSSKVLICSCDSRFVIPMVEGLLVLEIIICTFLPFESCLIVLLKPSCEY